MEPKKGKKNYAGLILLVACNLLLMVLVIAVTVLYSNGMKDAQEQMMLDNFCTTVETMKQISVQYLNREYDTVEDWAAYIQNQNMSMDEAMDYIRTISHRDNSEAHFMDVETFEVWSTQWINGSNTVKQYVQYATSEDPLPQLFMQRIQDMADGKRRVLGRYIVSSSQRSVISVGVPVMLRQPEGENRKYLLLRVMPVERMKELWLFPTSYPAAEIGLIDQSCNYVIPSYSMRSENFMEFVRNYNFADDYYGADRLLAQLKERKSGLMKLKDSRGQLCWWYYSAMEDFEGIDVLAYIPMSDLAASGDNLTIVFLVAGVLLVLALIDGAYILGINRRLRQTLAVAEKASAAKTQFLSTMSHDIRTPLNAVLGMTDLAQKHMDDRDYVRDCLKKISISGHHLLTLVNDILEISRVESGKISITPAPFDLRELVASLEDITRPQAEGKNLKFEILLGDMPEPYLMGDRLRLSQVYLNLLNNAVKYTPAGGEIRLEVEEIRWDGGVDLICIVKDTGIGMSPEFQKTMYDSFTRVADSRIDKIQGNGLGLSIVKRMVDLMDGTIDCVSTVGVGSAFTVHIPLEIAPAAAAPGKEPAAGAAESSLEGLRVLVAEDNELNWEIISQLLTERKIFCQRAENGRICVEMLNAAPPHTYDLVFMDIQMPELNGRDATRRLRAGEREDLRQIPVIAMTADAFAENVQLCLEAGMNGHVAKPIEIDKVMAAIRAVMKKE